MRVHLLVLLLLAGLAQEAPRGQAVQEQATQTPGTQEQAARAGAARNDAAGARAARSDAAQGDAAQLVDGGAAQREFASLGRALLSLPLAAVLAAMLAFRPRQRHATPRSPEVVQTQIMLALVGAMVMLVVGASLARAFGIAGAASLVRYRAKVSDPKDASVMLSALGIGLACGVGLYYLAAVASAFIVAVLWVLEWLEPRPITTFNLSVKRDDATGLRPRLEGVLRGLRLRHELRSSSPAELTYEVDVAVGRSLERISESILQVDPQSPPAIEWKKEKGK